MTRKHYIAFAKLISQARSKHDCGDCCDEGLRGLAIELADVLAHDNPRFNRSKFLAACSP